MSGFRNWYTVAELIAKLQTMPQDADVLLIAGVHDAEKALDDTWGLESGKQTMGATSVFEYDRRHVYIVHSTRPDCDDR